MKETERNRKESGRTRSICALASLLPIALHGMLQSLIGVCLAVGAIVFPQKHWLASSTPARVPPLRLHSCAKKSGENERSNRNGFSAHRWKHERCGTTIGVVRGAVACRFSGCVRLKRSMTAVVVYRCAILDINRWIRVYWVVSENSLVDVVRLEPCLNHQAGRGGGECVFKSSGM